MDISKVEQFATPLLRAGITVLFLWFGLSQLTSPSDWVAWVPPWTENFGLSATVVVLLNGLFETVLGALLAIGFYTRLAAFLLALHLLLVAYEIGYNDIGVRDFALAIATLSLAFFKSDQYTIDTKLSKENTPASNSTSIS
jgi:uncharacterized membrane protein YphA (DoxX/SURF4 family)